MLYESGGGGTSVRNPQRAADSYYSLPAHGGKLFSSSAPQSRFFVVSDTVQKTSTYRGYTYVRVMYIIHLVLDIRMLRSIYAYTSRACVKIYIFYYCIRIPMYNNVHTDVS